MGLSATDFLIEDGTSNDLLYNPVVGGVKMGHGYVERDWGEMPEGMLAPPSGIKLIPKSEWSARIKEMEETKSRLSDVRSYHLNGQHIPSLNQGSDGYCWGHSTTHANMMVRAINNQPHVPLSAFHVCAVIKKGANEGGWCGLSGKFLRDNGQCSQAYWPQGNRSLSLHTQQVRDNAAKHKVTEDWFDLTRQVYDQALTWDQVFTCLLLRMPLAGDFNWWGHSVALLDPVEVEPGNFGIRIWNSWGDQWGDKGLGVLRDNKAVPNGAVGVLVSGTAVD